MRTTSIAIIAIFGVTVALLLLLPGPVKQQIQGAALQLVSPILRTGASVKEQLGGVRGGLKRLDELERENRRLRLENNQLRTANALLRNLEGEVNRLSRALEFRERSPFRLLPARVIARDGAAWWNSCTIDQGSDQGIATDMAVVTEDGLVGKVTTTAKDAAMVLLVADESLRVSCSIEGTQEQGIVSGTRTSATEAPELRIRFLSKTANLQPGAKVFTAGTGGVFPSGVLVGTVKEFMVKELEGVATITPTVNLANVRDVFVIISKK
jgi:rod shape-determining protein MreC